jgi:hypothetical protein
MGMNMLTTAISSDPESSVNQIAEVGLAMTCLLIHKNMRYGNSALAPIEVFAKGITPRDRMAVRMDDKLNRMKNGLGTSGGDGEHPGIDLAGYLLLDVIADWQERGA